MESEEKAPSGRPDWAKVSSRTAGYLRAAGLDGTCLEVNPATGHAFAPGWARAIIEAPGTAERTKILALKKMARDPACRPAVASLMACIDPEDRQRLVEDLSLEFTQIVICPCGARFEEASAWRDHDATCTKK